MGVFRCSELQLLLILHMAGDKLDLISLHNDFPLSVLVCLVNPPSSFNGQLSPTSVCVSCPRRHNHFIWTDRLDAPPEKVLPFLQLQGIVEGFVLFVGEGLSKYCYGEWELLDFFDSLMCVKQATGISPSTIAITAIVNIKGRFLRTVLFACILCDLQLGQLPMIVSKEAIAHVEELKVFLGQCRLPTNFSIVEHRVVPHEFSTWDLSVKLLTEEGKPVEEFRYQVHLHFKVHKISFESVVFCDFYQLGRIKLIGSILKPLEIPVPLIRNFPC